MAKKKPEAIQALDALAVRPKCNRCDADAILLFAGENLCDSCRNEIRLQEAAQSLPAKLKRWPDEPLDAWRKRAFTWLKEEAKRIGSTA